MRGRKLRTWSTYSFWNTLKFIPVRGWNLDGIHDGLTFAIVEIYLREGTETGEFQAGYDIILLKFIPVRGRKLLCAIRALIIDDVEIIPVRGRKHRH